MVSLNNRLTRTRFLRLKSHYAVSGYGPRPLSALCIAVEFTIFDRCNRVYTQGFRV